MGVNVFIELLFISYVKQFLKLLAASTLKWNLKSSKESSKEPLHSTTNGGKIWC